MTAGRLTVARTVTTEQLRGSLGQAIKESSRGQCWLITYRDIEAVAIVPVSVLRELLASDKEAS